MSAAVDFTVGAALIAAVLVAIAAGVALLDAAGSAVALVWRRVVARPSSAGPEHNPSRRDHPVTVSKLARIAPQAREAGISGATPSDGAEDARSATQDAAGEALASVGPSDATGVPPEANRPQQAAQALSGPLPGEGGNEARAETGPEDGRCVSFSLGEFCADPSGGIPVAPKANAAQNSFHAVSAPLSVDSQSATPARRWHNRAAEALATIAGSLDRIEGAALVLVTANPDEPDDPSAREVRLVSFERDGGLLAQAFETMAASLDGGAIEEAAPAPRLN